MVLTKHEIELSIQTNKLAFSPELDGYQLQPHAVDLRLGLEFRLPKTWELTGEGRKAVNLDPLEPHCDTFEIIKLNPGQYFELLPKEFIIGITLEEISINTGNIMGVLYPRSSVNRRGLSVALSGIIDVGYRGRLMIPIINNTNEQIIRLYPGERICSVVFQQLASNLSAQDIEKHGLTKAKYHKSDSPEGKTDANAETKLIRSGNLDVLKSNYKLKL